MIAVAALGLLGTAVFGLATRDDPASSGPSASGEVRIVGFAYDPEVLEVAAGSTINWTNGDSAAHTVDGDELDSERLGEGESFEHTFEVPGTYGYACAIHPFMRGTVEVTG